MRDKLFTGLRTRLQRLHQEDDGTTLTEFVICLPVFIIVFMGLIDLYKMQNTSVEIQIMATKNMWKEAIPVQKSMLGKPIHMTAISGATTVVNVAFKRKQFDSGIEEVLHYVNYGTKAAEMGLGGHFGESHQTVFPIKFYIPGDEHNRARKLLNSPYDKAARELVDDSLDAGVLNLIKPGTGAGIRYGMVGGYAEKTAETRLGGTRSTKMTAGFDVTVAPYPHSGPMEHGITLFQVLPGTLHKQNYYKTAPGITCWFFVPFVSCGNRFSGP
jgi:hypothetical protein